MAPPGGARTIVLLGLCAGAFGGDVLAALKAQAERLEGFLAPAAAGQRYAFDPDICQCRAHSEPAPLLFEDFVARHCGGWGGGSRCVGVLDQGVRRVAPYSQTVLFAGANFTRESMQALKRQAVGHLNEQGDMLRSVKHIVKLLERGLTKQNGVTDAEVADRAHEARRFEGSPDRTVALRVGVPSQRGGHHLAEDQSCECFSVTQARSLWGDAADAEPGLGLRGASGPGHDLAEFAPADMSWPSTPSSALALARGRHVDRRLGTKPVDGAGTVGGNTLEDYADLAAKKYAKEHAMLTWVYLLSLPQGQSFEPWFNSGPLHPPYTYPSCGLCHCNPSLDVYGEGYIFPWALLSIGYWDSSPYGPCFTPCPQTLESSPWNECGRQWPERTCFSSHPSASSGLDDAANDEWKIIWNKHIASNKLKAQRRLDGSKQNEAIYGLEGSRRQTSEGGLLFFAPDSHAYDARLADALYSFARQGATVPSVKLFSTTIVWFQYLGVSPADSDIQHLGVTLEFSKPVKYDGGEWRFLTLELMGVGLMWQLTASAAPTAGYDYLKEITLAYDELSPKLVARYVADQRGRVYRTGSHDCQTFALELAHRLSLHGRSLHSVPDAWGGGLVPGPSQVSRYDHHESSFGLLFFASCALALALLAATLALALLAYRKTEDHKIVRLVLALAAAGTFLGPLLTSPPVLAAGAYAAWHTWSRYAKESDAPEDDGDKEAPIAEIELYPLPCVE